MHKRKMLLPALVLTLTLGVAGCSDSGTEEVAEEKGSLTIGAFNFSESEIVANIYADLLKEAGYEVEVKSLGAREVVEPALEADEIQLVPEYLGTFTEFLNTKENGPDAEPLASGDVESTLEAAREVASKRGLSVLEPAEAQDQNAFAVTRDFAEANDLSVLSDLADFDGELVLGGPPECPERPFCQPGLEDTYGITFTSFKQYAQFPLIQQGLVKGDIQLGLVFSSASGIATNDLVVLEDDKGLQTADNLTPVIRTSDNSEEIERVLGRINSVLTTDELIALNDQVDNQRKTPAATAEAWLKDKGLI